MIKSHKQRIIEGICINVKCHALKRQLHDKDEDLSRPYIISAD